MVAVLVDDVTAASADSPLLPQRSKRRERNHRELTEPGLPIRVRDGRARLAKNEAHIRMKMKFPLMRWPMRDGVLGIPTVWSVKNRGLGVARLGNRLCARLDS